MGLKSGKDTQMLKLVSGLFFLSTSYRSQKNPSLKLLTWEWRYVVSDEMRWKSQALLQRAFSTNPFRQRTKKTFLFFLQRVKDPHWCKGQTWVHGKNRRYLAAMSVCTTQGVQSHQLVSLCACLQKFALSSIKRTRTAMVRDVRFRVMRICRHLRLDAISSTVKAKSYTIEGRNRRKSFCNL